MADSFIDVTEGTGKGVDTRTESTNGHHRQVIIIGDPSTNAGVAPVDATAGLKVNLGSDNDITGTVTAELSAIDKAVLDAVNAVLDTIKVDTEAIETAVEALQAGQLADGHNVTIDNSTGVAAVNIQDGGNSITVDGTVAVTHTALTELASAINSDKVDVNIASSGISFGGTSAADDADFTAGTTPGTPAMGVYESTPTSVTDGDLGTVGITAGRRLKTSATIDAALPAGTNNIGDVDILSSALPTGASTSAKQDTVIGHLDGVETLLGTIDADTSTLAGVDFATQTTLAAINTKLASGTVIGDVNLGATDNAVLDAIAASVAAIDTDATTIIGHVDGIEGLLATIDADTGNIATSLGSLDNAVDGNYLNVNLNITGTDVSTTNAVPTKGVPSDIDINGSNANHAQKYYTNSGAVTDGIIWSPAAGKRWHILALYINVSAAATVTLEDDLVGGDSAVWKGELAANSGVVIKYDKEHPFCSTEDAADLIITTTAGNVYVQAIGYEV